ncbi:TPA: hypothetical protein DEP96_00915 [Candidatus Uhrbacteria bacterium]|nr:hypothetical protein [Candidatus Uhrbacteria bacterium]
MRTFASTPGSARRRFIGSLVVTLGTWAVLLFSGWTTVPFFLNEERTSAVAWIMFGLIWLTILFGAVVFTMSTRDNWRDYQRVQLVKKHVGGSSDIMSAYLSSYHAIHNQPATFWFSHFHHWLDDQESNLDSGDALDAVHQLEESGDLAIERPSTGGLLLALTPKFLQAHRLQA